MVIDRRTPLFASGLLEDPHNMVRVSDRMHNPRINKAKDRMSFMISLEVTSHHPIGSTEQYHLMWKEITQWQEYQGARIIEGHLGERVPHQQLTSTCMCVVVIKSFCGSPFHSTISKITNVSLFRRVTSSLEFRKTLA